MILKFMPFAQYQYKSSPIVFDNYKICFITIKFCCIKFVMIKLHNNEVPLFFIRYRSQ